MGGCDYSVKGKKHQIEKLAKICNKAGALVRTKYDRGGYDWTGISNFKVFQDLDELIADDMLYGGADEQEEIQTTADCECETWFEDEAKMMWDEITWAHKIPPEVWQLMRQEAKKLRVQRLVNDMITFLCKMDDVTFDFIEKEFRKQEQGVKYPENIF